MVQLPALQDVECHNQFVVTRSAELPPKRGWHSRHTIFHDTNL